MKNNFTDLLRFVGVWLFTFILFWTGALVWLHCNHEEVYVFFTPGHSIDSKQLEEFYADRRLAMLAVVLASTLLSQTAFAVISRKNTEHHDK